ncbi:hypothetical protein [Porphyromonas loveana]|uniref:hypothetical protein n=1 Tax=Porphyromonas loveana TaxID=1884669 RepID=UPI0035A1083B
MKKFITLIVAFFNTMAFGQTHEVFHTSLCYDMLSSFNKYEDIIKSPYFESTLAKDTVFINDIEIINKKVRPSNICNLYASLPTDKDDASKCYDFFTSLKQEDIPEKFNGQYVNNIFSVMPEILRVLQKLIDANYPKYWFEQVYPILKDEINGYQFEEGILDKIHTELEKMAGNTSLGEQYPKIYILDIDNAFSLNDETFCCTPILLNKEIAKQYRINFIQVYIHENLHRLYLSKSLIDKLDELYENDSFYRKNEDVAQKHGEGKNEAFIVAAETYISRKLGLKTDREVYQEFDEYVEGSLVLSPIIYQYISNKKGKDSFNDFLLNLFEKKYIKAGSVEKQYNEIMRKLKNNT